MTIDKKYRLVVTFSFFFSESTLVYWRVSVLVFDLTACSFPFVFYVGVCRLLTKLCSVNLFSRPQPMNEVTLVFMMTKEWNDRSLHTYTYEYKNRSIDWFETSSFDSFSHSLERISMNVNKDESNANKEDRSKNIRGCFVIDDERSKVVYQLDDLEAPTSSSSWSRSNINKLVMHSILNIVSRIARHWSSVYYILLCYRRDQEGIQSVHYKKTLIAS